MKHLFRVITAVLMAVLVAALLPAQVFAEGPEYISEVKIGIRPSLFALSTIIFVVALVVLLIANFRQDRADRLIAADAA